MADAVVLKTAGAKPSSGFNSQARYWYIRDWKSWRRGAGSSRSTSTSGRRTSRTSSSYEMQAVVGLNDTGTKGAMSPPSPSFYSYGLQRIRANGT